jgi:hypothetical protein
MAPSLHHLRRFSGRVVIESCKIFNKFLVLLLLVVLLWGKPLILIHTPLVTPVYLLTNTHKNTQKHTKTHTYIIFICKTKT